MTRVIQYAHGEILFSFTADAWFNATEAAKYFGKYLTHWLDNAETLEYLRALDEVLTGQPSEISNTRKSVYLKTRRGAGGGTWLHPKLAVSFARWLDAKFGVWCDLRIDHILRSGIQAQGRADLLPLFLRAEAAPWERRFPPEFYHALAKLTRTRYDGHAQGTPCIFGQLTERWVYACILPADVHSELKARRAQSDKMHQWLTDGGADVLDKQLATVTAIADTSCDLRDFEARMLALPNARGQLGFVFPVLIPKNEPRKPRSRAAVKAQAAREAAKHQPKELSC